MSLDGPFEMGKVEMSGSSMIRLPWVVFQTGRTREAGTLLALLVFPPRPPPPAPIQESSHLSVHQGFDAFTVGEGWVLAPLVGVGYYLIRTNISLFWFFQTSIF